MAAFTLSRDEALTTFFCSRQTRESRRWCDTDNEIDEKRLCFHADTVALRTAPDKASPQAQRPWHRGGPAAARGPNPARLSIARGLERPCEAHFIAVETAGKMTVGGEGEDHASSTVRIAPKVPSSPNLNPNPKGSVRMPDTSNAAGPNSCP